MRPTEEQERALACFLAGDPLEIHAYAGSGKTSTLVLMARASPRRGLYLAFNRVIAAEARERFPSRFACHTLHGFAFRAMCGRFGGDVRRLTGEINANRAAEALGLEAERVSRSLLLSPRQRGALVGATVRRFCQSDDEAPGPGHVPEWGILEGLSWWRRRGLAGRIARDAAALWERMADPAGELPLGHDGYLKLWALGNPVLPGEVVLLDEAQDSNDLTLGLVRRQPAQGILVGDRYQQIYEWRGAIDALGRLPGRRRVHLTRSFRFGPEIAGAASRILRALGERRPLRGNEGLRSRLHCPDPEILLCRTNGEMLARGVEALQDGLRVGVVGGMEGLRSELEDVERLQAGRPARGAAFFGYRDWREVVRAADREDVPELRALVRVTRRHGPGGLRRCLEAFRRREEEADLLLSTVHRAKGREWERVALAGDFEPFRRRHGGGRELDAAEARLLYVAVTRARREVAIPARLRRRFGIEG